MTVVTAAGCPCQLRQAVGACCVLRSGLGCPQDQTCQLRRQEHCGRGCLGWSRGVLTYQHDAGNFAVHEWGRQEPAGLCLAPETKLGS